MKISTKTELMNRVAAGELRETFHHSTEGYFDITGIRKMISDHVIACNIEKIKPDFEVVRVELLQIVPFILKNRVVDKERIFELSKSSVLQDPGIIISMNDCSHLTIDGTHRAIARAMLGEKYMLFYMMPEKFIIRPMIPDEFIREECQKHEWGAETIDENGKIVPL